MSTQKYLIKVNLLKEGKTFATSERGSSMAPRIKSGQSHLLAPTSWDKVKPGDIVFCKVRGTYYTHLIKAKNEQKGCLISNLKGHENGWTKEVYGKVIEIL